MIIGLPLIQGNGLLNSHKKDFLIKKRLIDNFHP